MNYSQLDKLFDRLWPICRSITGPGISESLSIISEYVPFKIKDRIVDATLKKKLKVEIHI